MLGSIEVENVDNHGRHVELRLEELVVSLVCLNMCVDSLLSILSNLLVVNFQQIKGDVISVSFEGICKELNLEWHT